MIDNPEIGQTLSINGFDVNLHDQGEGEVVLLLHGSGPGVTGFANWRLLIPELAPHYRVIAPDIAGFGYTNIHGQFEPILHHWVDFTIALLNDKGIDKAHLVGNSFGGALALALAHHHPERVGKMVLMGAAGVSFPITDGLEKVWGYQPSLANMKQLMTLFTSPDFAVHDDIVRMRYEASIRPGYQESYQRLFPEPRQQALENLCLGEHILRTIQHRTLIVHGKDDQIIPLQCSQTLLSWLPNADLHVFNRCGHWTMFEKAHEFNPMVRHFFATED